MNTSRNGYLKWFLVIVLTIAFCMFWFRKQPVFAAADWVVFGCTILFLIFMLFVIAAVSFAGREHPMVDHPLSTASILLFLAQIGFAAAWKLVPLSFSLLITVIIEAVIVGLFCMFMMPMIAAKNSIDAQDEYASRKVSVTRGWKAEVDTVAAMVQEASLKKELVDFSEQIRYSDPISGDDLASLEDRITSNLKLMHEDAEDKDMDRLRMHMEKAKALLAERNALCLAGKK